MKKVRLLLSLLLLLCMLSSCDFVRRMAERPDSAWIRAKKERIELSARMRDSLELVRKDSVLRAERAYADSLHAVDSLLKAGKLRKASEVSSIPESWLDARWGVVVGAFSNESNAEKLAAKYGAEGYRTRIFRTRYGLNILLVAPSSNIADAMKAFREVKRLPFASKESWMIVKE
ncbi:MAG: SPOR domain-containing protein [Bacteroidales bacterium]|nr:SPOR domain-containing protein [Bacteroidales bacterium]